jgi:beta-galactosidase
MLLCRGPHENYIDRQDGALVRLYSADISTLHTPYVAPSENGGRGGVRWMALMPEQTVSSCGCPIIVAVSQPVDSSEGCQPWPLDDADAVKASGKHPVFFPRDCFHFSASYYSTEDLYAAKHDHELPTGGPCYLHLDGVHMGVGGDDSWTPSVRSIPGSKCQA